MPMYLTQKAEDMNSAVRDSHRNQDLENGELDTFLNLNVQSRAARPKNIMIDSIRMNLDCVRIAVSNKRAQ